MLNQFDKKTSLSKFFDLFVKSDKVYVKLEFSRNFFVENVKIVLLISHFSHNFKGPFNRGREQRGLFTGRQYIIFKRPFPDLTFSSK